MGNCLSKRRGSLTLEPSAVRPQRLPSTSPEQQETITNAEYQGEAAKERENDANGLNESAKDQAAAAESNIHATTAPSASQAAAGATDVSDPAVVELTDDVPPEQELLKDTGCDTNEEEAADTPGLGLESNVEAATENPVTLIEMAKHAKDGYKQEELFAPAEDAKAKSAGEEAVDDGTAGISGDVGSGIPVLIVTDVSTTSTTNTESSEFENHSRSLSLTNQFHDSPKESEAVSAEDDVSDHSLDAGKETLHEASACGQELGESEESANNGARNHADGEPAGSAVADDDVETEAVASAGAGDAVQEDSGDVITTPARAAPEASPVIQEQGDDQDHVEPDVHVEPDADAGQACDEE